MSQGTWVLGGYRSDFARNWTKEELGFDALVAEVTRETLADAGVRADQVETIHVANAFGQLFTGQGHLGAMPATSSPSCGACPPAATKRRARRGAWPCWPPPPS